MSYFADLPKIRFEGPETDNPLAFRHYDADRLIMGKRMEDHLRWAVCYWHSFHWPGTDMFGMGTLDRPWAPGQPVTPARAALKMEAAFEFMATLGAPFYCFHDIDAIADHDGPAEYSANLDLAVDAMEQRMAQTGVRLLWGTANLTGHPRYAAGAATNPDPRVFAWAAHQVRSMLDATKRLGGANYVLWGGREGYDTILNTDIGRELDQLGRFMAMVVDHKHRIGFEGTIMIEPKPFEPAKHMYDRDSATVYGFLKRYGLEHEIKVNIEANHATLAGNSFEHEIATAAALGIFGSIDINRGDPQNGWDTDQFPNNVADLTVAIYKLLQAGGFTTGGFNFDAKVRRQSVDAEDLLHAHVGGVDTLARALVAAAAIIEDGQIDGFVADRYEDWGCGLGADIMSGRLDLVAVANGVVQGDSAPRLRSGRQEWLENIVNRHC